MTRLTYYRDLLIYRWKFDRKRRKLMKPLEESPPTLKKHEVIVTNSKI